MVVRVRVQPPRNRVIFHIYQQDNKWIVMFCPMDTLHINTFFYNKSFTDGSLIRWFKTVASNGWTIVGHDLFDKLLPFIEQQCKGFVWNSGSVMGFPMQWIDTIDYSRRLRPDRIMPHGSPTHEFGTEIDVHGLTAWTYRLQRIPAELQFEKNIVRQGLKQITCIKRILKVLECEIVRQMQVLTGVQGVKNI